MRTLYIKHEPWRADKNDHVKPVYYSPSMLDYCRFAPFETEYQLDELIAKPNEVMEAFYNSLSPKVPDWSTASFWMPIEKIEIPSKEELFIQKYKAQQYQLQSDIYTCRNAIRAYTEVVNEYHEQEDVNNSKHNLSMLEKIAALKAKLPPSSLRDLEPIKMEYGVRNDNITKYDRNYIFNFAKRMIAIDGDLQKQQKRAFRGTAARLRDLTGKTVIVPLD